MRWDEHLHRWNVRTVQADDRLLSCDTDRVQGYAFVADGSKKHHGAGANGLEKVSSTFVPLELH